MGCAPFEPFSKRLSGITATPTRSRMWRPCSKKLLSCRRGAPISLTIGLRCWPLNTNLHTMRARKAITDRIASAIQIQPGRKWTTASVAFSPMPAKRLTPPAGLVSAAASGRLAARDGMNHQDFVLLARDFREAFAGRHVKWLSAGLGFIFGNHVVHFFHVSGCRIVFKKCLITLR